MSFNPRFLYPVPHQYFVGEERQNQNAKRQRIERGNFDTKPNREPLPPPRTSPLAPQNAQTTITQHPLPRRPSIDPFLPGGPVRASPSEGMKALGGSNADVVNNRAAIRMANMSAAESLKAELAAKIPLGRKPVPRINAEHVLSDSSAVPSTPPIPSSVLLDQADASEDNGSLVPVDDIPAASLSDATTLVELPSTIPQEAQESEAIPTDSAFAPEVSELQLDSPQLPVPVETASEGDQMDTMSDSGDSQSPRGVKRKAADLDEPVEDTDEEPAALEDVDTDQADVSAVTRKVNPDGTVEQEDTVR